MVYTSGKADGGGGQRRNSHLFVRPPKKAQPADLPTAAGRPSRADLTGDDQRAPIMTEAMITEPQAL